MTLYTCKLTSKNRELLKNEILFAITSAKALHYDLLRLDFPDNASETCVETIARILRIEKKNGFFQLYISPAELDNNSPEAEYTKNKHPELSELDKNEKCFFVKI